MTLNQHGRCSGSRPGSSAPAIVLFSLIWFQAVPGSAADEAKPEGAKVVVPDVTEEDTAKLEKLQGLIRKKAEADRDETEKQKVAAEKAILEGEEGEAKNKPAEDQEPDPAEMQGMEYFRRFSRCEVYLIHKCCDLTSEQIKQLSDAGEKEIQRLFAVRRGRNPAAQQLLQENGIVRILPNGRRISGGSLDFRSSLRLAISKEAESFLAPEKLAVYKTEVEKRELSRKRASIQMVVARIDRDLSLTSEQREKLVETLIQSLNGTEYSAPEELLLNNQMQAPPLPPKLIEPLLTEFQKTAWRRLPKSRQSYNFDEMMMNNGGGNQLGLSVEDLGSLISSKPSDAPQQSEEPK